MTLSNAYLSVTVIDVNDDLNNASSPFEEGPLEIEHTEGKC